MKFSLSSWRLLMGLGVLSLFSGCTAIYMPTGSVLTSYAKNKVVPYVLADNDVGVSTCGTGNGLTQFVGSFGAVTGVGEPDYVLFYTDLLTGFCAEQEAYDADLRYTRASQANLLDMADDELVLSKRKHAEAARRRLKALNHLTQQYGPLGTDQCPNLFSDDDELAYLVGLVTALQAVRSDLLSGGQVHVSRSLANKTMISSQCLDNNKWWGAPEAIRATVWAFVPGAKPEDKDIWQSYRHAASLAKRDGATLPLILYALGADNQGKKMETRNAIWLAGKIQQQTADNFDERYQLVNNISNAQLMYMSDKIWMQLTGVRTPAEKFGTFPDDAKKEANIDGLL